MRHSEYIKILLNKRENETKQIDPIHERGESLSSPPGATSLEENRIITEYMEHRNLQQVVSSMPGTKKPILLKKFFKRKRNQQVIVYTNIKADTVEITGKVSAIGRDFVMLTNLKDRIWIPYSAIESANIPAGVPNYDNSHQYFIYDNDLKRKLMTSFGETVSQRDALLQQFFEETLMTNLNSLEGMWVKVLTRNETFYGKIASSSHNGLVLRDFNNEVSIEWESLSMLASIRLFQRLFMICKNLLRGYQN